MIRLWHTLPNDRRLHILPRSNLRLGDPLLGRHRLKGVFFLSLLLLVADFAWSPPAYAQFDPSEEIVYIDLDGFIRVLDLTQTGSNPVVQWRSPDGGWRDFTLGDFNGDGDMEIAALRGEENSGLLTIFDPVVVSGVVPPGQRINGIPWKVLYSLPLNGKPLRLAAGNFNNARAADELALVVELPDNATGDPADLSEVSILQTTAGGSDGTAWEYLIERRAFSNVWTAVTTGDLDYPVDAATSIDELLLLDDDTSILAIYRIHNGLDDVTDRIFNSESNSKEWRAVTTANYYDDRLQVAAVRTAPLGLPSFLVFQYDITNVDTPWMDRYSEQFVPNPRMIFGADIDGTGSDELFMLREVPDNIPNRPRLFKRPIEGVVFEDLLDNDNGYRAGAGGDVDADGRDEIVLIRSNRIRVYTTPEQGSATKQEYAFTTNGHSIGIGNLDALGFAGMPALQVSPTSLTTTVAQGQRSQIISVAVSNSTTNEAIPFVVSVEGTPSWVVADATGAATPAEILVTLDATNLFPGFYQTQLVITSPTDDVVNSPTYVAIAMTVKSALAAFPASVNAVYLPCDDPLPLFQQALEIEGPFGEGFTAAVTTGDTSTTPAAWATVAPTSGNVPTTLTITIDPSARSDNFARATLILTPDGTGTLDQSTIVPVYLTCAQAQVLLPFVMNR